MTESLVPIEETVEIIRGGKKNIIMDSQILTALMACARYTDFRFNMKLLSINGKSNSLECGSIVHKFLEIAYKSIINGLNRNQAFNFGIAAAELYIRGCQYCTNFIPTDEINKPICGHPINEYPGLKNTPQISEDYKTGWQYVLDTCDQYWKFRANDHWVPLEIEVVKGEVLYEDDEIRILWKAKLDALFDTNQGIYPVDHKSMKQNRNQTNLNNQFTGQCILTKTGNVWINKIGFQKTLPPEEKFIRTPINYSASRLFEWQSETLPFYAKLLLMYSETGHFPPNFTSCDGKYGACAFKKICEADMGMREELLKENFIIGPEWNPSNSEDETYVES